MWALVAIIGIASVSLAAAHYRERRAVRGLPVLEDEELLQSKPADIPDAVWVALRDSLARALAIPSNKLDPSQELDDLHRRTAFLEISRVDVEDLMGAACKTDAELDRVRPRVYADNPSTIGDLMVSIIRGRSG